MFYTLRKTRREVVASRERNLGYPKPSKSPFVMFIFIWFSSTPRLSRKKQHLRNVLFFPSSAHPRVYSFLWFRHRAQALSVPRGTGGRTRRLDGKGAICRTPYCANKYQVSGIAVSSCNLKSRPTATGSIGSRNAREREKNKRSMKVDVLCER